MTQNGKLTDAQEHAIRKVSQGPGGATAWLVGSGLLHGPNGSAEEVGENVLRSLERRGLVRVDAGLWTLTPAGRKAIGGGER